MTDPVPSNDFEPCYCAKCDGKLPAPCRYYVEPEQRPSKDLVYELRKEVLRDYPDERQLKHDAAGEIEHLRRENVRWENAHKILLAENARLRLELNDSITNHNLKDIEIERLRRPAHEREGPHCSTCACGLTPEPAVARCKHGNPIDPTGSYVCMKCFNEPKAVQPCTCTHINTPQAAGMRTDPNCPQHGYMLVSNAQPPGDGHAG